MFRICFFVLLPVLGFTQTVPPADFALTNAAKNNTPDNTIAPLEILTLYGAFGGNGSGAKLGQNLPIEIDGTKVFFNDAQAPLLYVGANQINVLAPWSNQVFDNAPVIITFNRNGKILKLLVKNIAKVRPAIYGTAGISDVYDPSWKKAGTAGNPPIKVVLRQPVVVEMFVNGCGTTTPLLQPGQLVPEDRLYHANTSVEVTMNEIAGQVLFFGSVPGSWYGTCQLNLSLPPSALSFHPGANTDSAEVKIKIGDAAPIILNLNFALVLQ